jgi:hypothetical protein
LNHTVVHLRYSLWNRTAKQPYCRCQASEGVRLADTLRPKRSAALLPCEKNSMFYACVFAFWILYWEQGFQNRKVGTHMQSFPGEELDWWKQLSPTPEELRFSGGLQVEDWPHARQVERLSVQLFEATQPLHELDERALRLLERAAFLHNTGMLIEARRHHKHSYQLIKGTTLPDVTEEERHEIACIARYHRRALPVSHTRNSRR